MLRLDDDSCIDEGICGDLLPQFFELAEGSVRIRAVAKPGDEREARKGQKRSIGRAASSTRS